MGKTLTAEQWTTIEERIKHGGGAVLLVDGLKVTFCLKRLKEFQFAICFYVDEVFKGKWLGEDCPERRLFCRPVTKSIWTAKQKAIIAKTSKRMLKRMGVDPAEKHTSYYPWWTQFNALKRHLNKHALSIELVEG